MNSNGMGMGMNEPLNSHHLQNNSYEKRSGSGNYPSYPSDHSSSSNNNIGRLYSSDFQMDNQLHGHYHGHSQGYGQGSITNINPNINQYITQNVNVPSQKYYSSSLFSNNFKSDKGSVGSSSNERYSIFTINEEMNDSRSQSFDNRSFGIYI